MKRRRLFRRCGRPSAEGRRVPGSTDLRFLPGGPFKLVKFQGPFVWHRHDHEDELFLVVRGSFRMEFRDRSIDLRAGEFLIVPRGIYHRPVAEEEVEVLLFEPAGTLNTGTAGGARTVPDPERL